MRSNRLIAVMALILSCFTLTSCNDDDDNNNGAEKENNGGKAEIKVNNNGHEYTDLGLSVYWATCNVGAYSPTTQGNKYAFGETVTKNEFTNSNYVGGSEDAAKQIWGGDWRLPTRMELEELVEKCSWARRTVNGIQVVTATGPNGNSIDLPYYSYIQNEGYYGWYWSSTASTYSKAYCMRFKGNEIGVGTNEKYNGFLTRGVMTNPNYSGFNNNSDEDNGGGSGGGSSTETLYFTNFTYTATQTSVTVKFYTNERASSATIKYGERSAVSSASATIINKEISATIRGLKKGTKYYIKCIARNSSGSVTSDDYPVMTNY